MLVSQLCHRQYKVFWAYSLHGTKQVTHAKSDLGPYGAFCARKCQNNIAADHRTKAQRLDPPQRRVHETVMLIYKILRTTEWARLEEQGKTCGAPIDVQDGYIHLSTGSQAAETAAKHFAGENDLWLLALDSETLGRTLKWEISRGGADFPHLYRELKMSDVLWAVPLPLENGKHQFPSDLTGSSV